MTQRRGNVATIFAFSLLPLTGFGALAVDIGFQRLMHSQASAVATLAATAAVNALPDQVVAEQLAVDIAAANWVGAQNGQVSLIEFGLWDYETDSFTALTNNSTTPNAARVVVSGSAPSFLARTLGFTQFESAGVAVAVSGAKSGVDCGGVIAERTTLSSTATMDGYQHCVDGPYLGPTVDAALCGNGSIDMMSRSLIMGNAHPGPNESGIDYNSNARVTGNDDPLLEPMDIPDVDPLFDAAFSVANDCTPPVVHGAKLKLKSGKSVTCRGSLYVKSLNIKGGASLIVEDHTDVFVDGGNVNVWANGILASDTEDPAGITVYMRGSGTTFTVRANGEFTGSLIAPDSELKVRSGGEFTGMFIVDELSLKSSTEVHIDQCLVDAYTLTDLRPTLPGGSVLVQ